MKAGDKYKMKDDHISASAKGAQKVYAYKHDVVIVFAECGEAVIVTNEKSNESFSIRKDILNKQIHVG